MTTLAQTFRKPIDSVSTHSRNIRATGTPPVDSPVRNPIPLRGPAPQPSPSSLKEDYKRVA
jgi:hypothetical protein